MTKYTPEELGQYLQQLIDRHRKDLSILLQANGVTQEPTPSLLLACYIQFGDEFIKELAKLGEEPFQGNISNIEGAGIVEKLTNFFEIITGKTPAEAITGTRAGSAAPTSEAETETAPKKEPISTKKIIIIGLCIVAVLTVIYLAVRKSNP